MLQGQSNNIKWGAGLETKALSRNGGGGNNNQKCWIMGKVGYTELGVAAEYCHQNRNGIGFWSTPVFYHSVVYICYIFILYHHVTQQWSGADISDSRFHVAEIRFIEELFWDNQHGVTALIRHRAEPQIFQEWFCY